MNTDRSQLEQLANDIKRKNVEKNMAKLERLLGRDYR